MNMEIQAALDVVDETDSFLQITDVIYDKEADVGYEALNQAERTVFCIDGLLREMENGGFSQLMYHDSGGRVSDILAALESIKSREVIVHLKHFIALFGEHLIPADDDERIALFEAVESEQTDVITELDDCYYDTVENLVGLTLAYVARNQKRF